MPYRNPFVRPNVFFFLSRTLGLVIAGLVLEGFGMSCIVVSAFIDSLRSSVYVFILWHVINHFFLFPLKSFVISKVINEFFFLWFDCFWRACVCACAYWKKLFFKKDNYYYYYYRVMFYAFSITNFTYWTMHFYVTNPV